MSAVKERPGVKASAFEDGVARALAARAKAFPPPARNFGANDARHDRGSRELCERLAFARCKTAPTREGLQALRRRIGAADPALVQVVGSFLGELARGFSELRSDHGPIHFPPLPTSDALCPRLVSVARYSDLNREAGELGSSIAELIALVMVELADDVFGAIDKSKEERDALVRAFDDACCEVRWRLEDTVRAFVDRPRGLLRVFFRWEGEATDVPVYEPDDGPGDAVKRLVGWVVARSE